MWVWGLWGLPGSSPARSAARLLAAARVGLLEVDGLWCWPSLVNLPWLDPWIWIWFYLLLELDTVQEQDTSVFRGESY